MGVGGVTWETQYRERESPRLNLRVRPGEWGTLQVGSTAKAEASVRWGSGLEEEGSLRG